jgi:hypothetical protein
VARAARPLNCYIVAAYAKKPNLPNTGVIHSHIGIRDSYIGLGRNAGNVKAGAGGDGGSLHEIMTNAACFARTACQVATKASAVADNAGEVTATSGVALKPNALKINDLHRQSARRNACGFITRENCLVHIRRYRPQVLVVTTMEK